MMNLAYQIARKKQAKMVFILNDLFGIKNGPSFNPNED